MCGTAEFSELLRQRRSIKEFEPTPVSRGTLLDLVEAARFSPSANNKNPWRFVLVTERQALDRLSETHPYCRWLHSAQAAIAIAVDPTATRYWLEDCSIAAYSIWLAATAKRVGVAWAAMYQSDNPAESERRQQFVRDILGIPATLAVPMVLGIGYFDKVPPEKPRPELREIVHFERYGQAGAQQATAS